MVNIFLIISLISSDPNVGTNGFDLLKITLPARQAAMGCAALGLADDAFGFYFNPAGLVDIEGPQFGVSYMNYVAGVQLGALSYSRPMADKGFGFGLTYLNSGSMKKTDISGNEEGTFSVSYANFDVALGLLFTEPIAVGLGVKGLYNKIDTFFAVGAGLNLGGSFLLPVEGLHLGVAVRNIGAVFKPYRSERDKLPLDFGAGLNYARGENLNLNLDLVKSLSSSFSFRLGAEAWANQYLAVRAGYYSLGSDLKTGTGSDILAGLSFGLGVRVLQYQLDYGFTPMLDLGRVHRFTLSFAL
ncbi:MAG: PorV/PorQ family protein [bacterium]|nr:PorV/PorQ family protein [candidate division WOR-3 bacterium]